LSIKLGTNSSQSDSLQVKYSKNNEKYLDKKYLNLFLVVQTIC